MFGEQVNVIAVEETVVNLYRERQLQSPGSRIAKLPPREGGDIRLRQHCGGMLDRGEIQPRYAGNEHLLLRLARRHAAVFAIQRVHVRGLFARRHAARHELAQIVRPFELGEVQVVVLVLDGERWRQAVDANHFAVQDPVAEILHLEH